MNNDKELTFERYIDQELNLYEAELKANPNRRTYTEEEFFSQWKEMVDNWEQYRKPRKCIS
jgi:hypothetical protein